MDCADKINKYNKVSVSDKTAEGMSLKSDDLQYISRMLSLQDLCTEDSIANMEQRLTKSLVDVLVDYNNNILSRLDDIKADLLEVKADIKKIKVDILDIYKEISTLHKKVTAMEKRITALEKQAKI